MTRIHILGGTGYAGRQIVAEAARRGHQVTSFSRSIPTEQTPGVEYRAGDVQDPAYLASVFTDTDVVISALSTRGGLAGEGRMRALVAAEAELAAGHGVRLGVMGGAGSLQAEEGGPDWSTCPTSSRKPGPNPSNSPAPSITCARTPTTALTGS
ncbi:NAD(P)-dependent oxidoreductase [Corynebacterium variabile]|uniref:NAD(P)-dependent oxidoreductase n=1 Tax=Corynebacterium variabile TaxID=1727 RepID=UPI003A9409F6